MDLNSLDKDLVLPYPDNKKVKTIKSLNNNQYVSVIPQTLNDETYAVQVNDLCVYGYQDKYLLNKCASVNTFFHPQYFEIKRVLNNSNARTEMNSTPMNDTGMPFTIFKHKSTQKCLSLDNEGLYLDKCDANNIAQKWHVSPNENLCVD